MCKRTHQVLADMADTHASWGTEVHVQLDAELEVRQKELVGLNEDASRAKASTQKSPHVVGPFRPYYRSLLTLVKLRKLPR